MQATEEHLVIPGQVIAVSESDEDGFLRGHGTYVEEASSSPKKTLRASVLGMVKRVNKLIYVESFQKQLNVGDLVVGRIASIGNARWSVDLGVCVATLPLSNLHLPVQRIRTSSDALEMRNLLAEGDLMSAEIHKTSPQMTLSTRTSRYGKVSRPGLLVVVDPYLIPKRPTHFFQMCGGAFEILLGVNGYIWMQKYVSEDDQKDDIHMALSETERRDLIRLKQSVLVLKTAHLEISPEHIESIYETSKSVPIKDMLEPSNVLKLSASIRNPHVK